MSQIEILLSDLSLSDLLAPLLKNASQKLNFNLSSRTSDYIISIFESRLSVAVLESNHYKKPDAMISVQYLEALQEDGQKKQFKLKALGDSILFRTGLFAPSLRRKLSGIKFHINMGATVYRSLYAESQNPIYEDLSNRFPSYVDLISRVGRDLSFNSRADVFSLVDCFLDGKSKVAEADLLDLGFSPHAIKKYAKQ